MNAVFFSSNSRALDTVYNLEIREKLFEKLDFIADFTNFDTNYLDSRTDELASVGIIFSTWGMPHFTHEQIKKYLPSLKAVFYGAGSVQGFAREFIECGVTVVSAWAANGVPVAEFTVAQIVLANKGYFQRFHHVSSENWNNRGNCGTYNGNYHAKVGIIGAGMIGRLVIERLKSFVIDTYVFDPFLSDESARELGVIKMPLPEIFETCDVISNHLANNAQTVGMLGTDCFSRMKPNGIFINTGRGAQVDESALCDAMRSSPNRAALLDVTLPEPPLDNSELYRLPNVFLSPHIAGSLGNEVERMGVYMYEEFLAFSENRPLRWGVSIKMLDTMA